MACEMKIPYIDPERNYMHLFTYVLTVVNIDNRFQEDMEKCHSLILPHSIGEEEVDRELIEAVKGLETQLSQAKAPDEMQTIPNFLGSDLEDVRADFLPYLIQLFTEVHIKNERERNFEYALVIPFMVSSFESTFTHLYMEGIAKAAILEFVTDNDINGITPQLMEKVGKKITALVNGFKGNLPHKLLMLNELLTMPNKKQILIDGLELMSAQEMVDIVEIFQTRHVLAHNFGIIDEDYLKKLPENLAKVEKNMGLNPGTLKPSFLHEHEIEQGMYHTITYDYFGHVFNLFRLVIRKFSTGVRRLSASDEDYEKILRDYDQMVALSQEHR